MQRSCQIRLHRLCAYAVRRIHMLTCIVASEWPTMREKFTVVVLSPNRQLTVTAACISRLASQSCCTSTLSPKEIHWGELLKQKRKSHKIGFIM